MPLNIEQCKKCLDEIESNYFDLGDCGIGDDDLPQIVALLNQYPKIISLDLSRNNIENENLELAKLKYIKALDLTRNNLDKETVLPLLQNKQFEELYLDYNYLEDAGEIIVTHSQQLKLSFENIIDLPEEWKQKIAERIVENNRKKQCNKTLEEKPKEATLGKANLVERFGNFIGALFNNSKSLNQEKPAQNLQGSQNKATAVR